MIWRLRSLFPLLITVLAAIVLGAGASPGHAATTRTVPATYNYDHPATFAPDAYRSLLRERGTSAGSGAGFQGDLAALRLAKRLGVAAKGGSKLVEGARYPLSPKIQGQLAKRGWTTEAIDETVRSGKQVRELSVSGLALRQARFFGVDLRPTVA